MAIVSSGAQHSEPARMPSQSATSATTVGSSRARGNVMACGWEATNMGIYQEILGFIWIYGILPRNTESLGFNQEKMGIEPRNMGALPRKIENRQCDRLGENLTRSPVGLSDIATEWTATTGFASTNTSTSVCVTVPIGSMYGICSHLGYNDGKCYHI